MSIEIGNRKRLRVGLTFNLKRIVPGPAGDHDSEAEFDSPSTIRAIRDAIASHGHDVIELEATPDLPTRLSSSNVDVVFNLAEGSRGRGREAQVPALLELMGIPYSGSDAATMVLTLDKALAKRVVRDAGVATPDFFVVHRGEKAISKTLRYPAIVKPVAEGSSKGVAGKCVVENDDELRSVAAAVVSRYDQGALVEEYLPGREFTAVVLGNRDRMRVLPPMEVIFTRSDIRYPVYAFEHKLDFCDDVRYEVPAKVDPALGEALEALARKAFASLRCRDVARIDIRLDADGQPNFIECNPLPGLTPDFSDLCLITNAAGMTYPELIGEILTPAMVRGGMAEAAPGSKKTT